jgi:hypothetical protein
LPQLNHKHDDYGSNEHESNDDGRYATPTQAIWNFKKTQD